MNKEPDSTECPMCGRSVPSDATSCPGCGTDLSMSSLEELEKVAKSISSGEPMPSGEDPVQMAEVKQAPSAPKAPEPESKPKEEGAKEGKHFGGKLFGKRKK
ncbi:MAG: zinc-ribbon domain-containing protein [Methanomassiliicoccales archaeon]|nr:zinc-ribbon domain-containing protein [Methanomassiliicoccales archaeon]